jgi:hypothetical protein
MSPAGATGLGQDRGAIISTMYRVVFWNVNKKDLSEHVCSIALATEADAIVLNENSIEAASPRSSVTESLVA